MNKIVEEIEIDLHRVFSTVPVRDLVRENLNNGVCFPLDGDALTLNGGFPTRTMVWNRDVK